MGAHQPKERLPASVRGASYKKTSHYLAGRTALSSDDAFIYICNFSEKKADLFIFTRPVKREKRAKPTGKIHEHFVRSLFQETIIKNKTETKHCGLKTNW